MRNITLLVIITMIMSLGAKPSGAFKYYEYKSSTMREYPHEYYRLEYSGQEGAVLSWAKCNSEVVRVRVPEDAVRKVDSLIGSYKLYKLKKTYRPPFMVHDGIQWHVYLGYEQGNVSCIADNAWPPEKLKEGIKAVNAYLDSLIKSAEE